MKKQRCHNDALIVYYNILVGGFPGDFFTVNYIAQKGLKVLTRDVTTGGWRFDTPPPPPRNFWKGLKFR